MSEIGSALVMYVEGGRVVLESRERLAARLRREVAENWRGSGSVVDELIADRRAEAARDADPGQAWPSSRTSPGTPT